MIETVTNLLSIYNWRTDIVNNYVLIYTGGSEPQTEEEGAKVMAAWGAWMGGLGEALVDGGNPFAAGKSIAGDGSVSDSPFGTPATGYSIIQAGSFDEAVGKAKGCPHLKAGGQVSVYETIKM